MTPATPFPIVPIPGTPVGGHRGAPRVVVDRAGWRYVAERLGSAAWSLLGLWGDTDAVHAAILDPGTGTVGVATLACPKGRFPSLGGVAPAAIRLERAAGDLFGLVAEGSPDPRPWLDHGRWPVRAPLSARPSPVREAPPAYRFLAVEGEGLHQIPVGPVHAGIIEPGHFRFTAQGETVVRLEERLGYVHKGIEGLIAGADIERAARLVGRVSGDSTVAYATAFARAVETALSLGVPPRAHLLRGLMAELERIANHCGDVGAICNDASFVFLHNQFAMLRETVLRAAAACFGHRLMMDRVVPGGVATDLDKAGASTLWGLVQEIERRLPGLVDIYDNKASLLDRTVATGIVSADLVNRFAAGGYVGRASGRTFDTRRDLAYPPYGDLRFEVPVLTAGDVHARLMVRIREIEASLGLIGQMLARLEPGPARVDLPAPGEGPLEGLAMVEGFRGDILVWLRLGADGRVQRCHPRDPSWFHWPLLEAAIENNIVADFPLCNKSFNCSYSGHDL